MIDLVLHDRTTRHQWSRAFVARVCAATEKYLKVPKGHRAEIGVTFIGPTAMRTLNRERRRVDEPTDVLSFPLHMKPIPGYTPIVLGDLFICPGIVRKKATESGLPVRTQMAWTVIHGLLHLAGYSHTAMRPHEQSILKKL
jgi:probable rRNA maturation factor